MGKTFLATYVHEPTKGIRTVRMFGRDEDHIREWVFKSLKAIQIISVKEVRK